MGVRRERLVGVLRLGGHSEMRPVQSSAIQHERGLYRSRLLEMDHGGLG